MTQTEEDCAEQAELDKLLPTLEEIESYMLKTYGVDCFEAPPHAGQDQYGNTCECDECTEYWRWFHNWEDLYDNAQTTTK